MTAKASSPTWLRSELAKLAASAEENAIDDRVNAQDAADEEDRKRYEQAAAVADHYGRQIRRILDGKTWDQAFAERAKRSR